jgi:hypothetical protein
MKTSVEQGMAEVSQTMNWGEALIRKVTAEWDAWVAQGYIEFIIRIPLLGEIPIKIPFAKANDGE